MKEKKQINIGVGHRIKKVRESTGYTQDKFAEIIGMGTKNLSSVERGEVGISIEILQRMCQQLSISSDLIIYDNSIDNNIDLLNDRLKNLSKEQYEIINEIINKIIEGFNLSM